MRKGWVMSLVSLMLCHQAMGQESFCVQTLNAYGPIYGLNLEKRTKNLVSTLEKNGFCTLLNLQEVWREEHRELLRRLLAKSNSPKPTVLFSDERRSDENRIGLAKIGVGELVDEQSYLYFYNESGALDWIRDLLGVEKGFSVSRWKFGESSSVSEVLFINTHLHPQSQSLRLAQLTELAFYLIRPSSFDQPVILSGDFNAEPESLEWQFIVHALGFTDATADQTGCTYCSENPLGWDSRDRKIDFIFSRPSWTKTLISQHSKIIFKPIGSESFSDHYGLETHFTLIPSLRFLRVTSSNSSQLFTEAIHTLLAVEEKLYDSGREELETLSSDVAKLRWRLEERQSHDEWANFLESLTSRH